MRPKRNRATTARIAISGSRRRSPSPRCRVCAGVAFAGGGGVDASRAPQGRPTWSASRPAAACTRRPPTPRSSSAAATWGTSRRSSSTPTAAAGSRPTRSPSPAARSRSEVPDGRGDRQAEGHRLLRQQRDVADRRSRSSTPAQIPDSGQLQAHGASPRSPASPTTTARRSRSVTYMFTNSEPTDVRIDVVKRPDGTVVDSWIEHAQEPNTVHTANWNGVRARQAGLQRRLQVPRRPRERQHGVDHRGQVHTTTASSSRFAAVTATATASAPRGPATPTRDRTSWRDAAPRWWRPAAAGCSGRPTRQRRRLLPGDRRQEDRPRLRLHAPEEAVPSPQGASGADRPADRRRGRDAATPPAATCTSRSGRRPAGTRAGTS